MKFNIKKMQTGKIDLEDIGNKTSNEKSAFGKLVAYQQNNIQTEARGIKNYLTEAFKGMKHVRAASKVEQNQ